MILRQSFPVAWRQIGPAPDPADILRVLMEREGLSARALAKQLAGGDQATERDWDSKRRLVTLWLRGRRRGGSDPDDQSLSALAEALREPAYLLHLLYRHEAREAELRQYAQELGRALGLQLEGV